MEIFLKIYLPCYFVSYMLVAFVLPSYRTWKQTGNNPITFGKEDTAHNYIGMVMKLLIAGLAVAIIIFSSGERLYNFLLPAWYFQRPAVLITGLCLIHLSLAWIIIAQVHMSNSWRIGIDEIKRTELVTKGLFSISRNPVFLGMIISTLGIFLIIPNAVTFFTLGMSYVIIQIQVRLEEEHLQKQHGTIYNAYKEKVGRFL